MKLQKCIFKHKVREHQTSAHRSDHCLFNIINTVKLPNTVEYILVLESSF